MTYLSLFRLYNRNNYPVCECTARGCHSKQHEYEYEAQEISFCASFHSSLFRETIALKDVTQIKSSMRNQNLIFETDFIKIGLKLASQTSNMALEMDKSDVITHAHHRTKLI